MHVACCVDSRIIPRPGEFEAAQGVFYSSRIEQQIPERPMCERAPVIEAECVTKRHESSSPTA